MASPSGCSPRLFLIGICFVVMAFATGAEGQMVPGSRVVGEAEALGLDRDHASREFKIEEIGCSAPANVLWPGDPVSLTFRITNLTGTALTASGTIEAIQYGTRGKPGDIWEPLFYKIGTVDSAPIQVNLAVHGTIIVTITPRIPETLGGYVFVAELTGHGRRFAASMVRSMEPDEGAVQIPAYALDLQGTSEETARFFKRMGIKGARLGLNAFPSTDPAYARKWNDLSQQLKTLQENEVTAMVTTGAGDLPMPMGRPRPHLTDDGTFKETKMDWSWLPSADAEFAAWVKKVCGTYGWPKGPINAFELWNEPWEGISISGWGADMARYRDIFTAMAQAIEQARAEDGTQVLIGGCGSSSNTIDKLFPDGSDTFLKWLDFCSIHYQVMSATPALMKDFIHRPGPNGPVRVWDTESWIANSEDRVGLVVASMHAMGQERAMGVYAGNVYDPESVVLADGKRGTLVQAWSTAAAVGASTKFVGQRKFRELLFQNGLPWIFVFDGRQGKTVDDGTVVVAGDLSGCYSRDLLLFRTVNGLKNQGNVRELKGELAALPANAPDTQRMALQAKLNAASIMDGGSLTISDGGGEYVLTDFYGNPIPSAGGKITVPLNGYGYYLRTNGSAGSFARLLAELRRGRVEGYEPVEIIPHDLTARVSTEPVLRLTLTNVLNRAVTGMLAARMGSVALASGSGVTLAANETREIPVKVTGVETVASNRYPLHIEFDGGADGAVTHDEDIHVNVISKRTIKVDGNLDDRRDVIPQTLAGNGIGASLTERAWLPFAKFDDSAAQGAATGYLAYDDKNFYFAARIADSTPDEGMARFETRDDDSYFYPETCWRIDETASFAKTDKTETNPDLHNQPLMEPAGDGRSNVAWESVAASLAFDLNMTADTQHEVAFYLLSWDPLGRHDVNFEISDAVTGKVLNRQTIKDFRDGKYAIFDVSGDVRVKITSNNWLKGVLSGIFFDGVKNPKPVSGTTVEFVGMDERTGGNWKGVHGSDGYEIAGAGGKLPSYAQVAFSTQITKQKLQWPDGVRRFSYRKRPDLPAGGPESHDNVQIAFNVEPEDKKPWIASPTGTPPHWMMYWDSDYEYALNQVAARYGGGTEIWRLQVPGMPRKHFFPREPKSPFDGPVKDGKLVMRREGNTRIVEASLPWTEMPDVKKRLDAGETVKFDFRVNDNGGPSEELATGRSVSKQNCITFHNDWQVHWANELEFGVEK